MKTTVIRFRQEKNAKELKRIRAVACKMLHAVETMTCEVFVTIISLTRMPFDPLTLCEDCAWCLVALAFVCDDVRNDPTSNVVMRNGL